MTDLGISGFDGVELVGRGAVGLVYKARQTGLDRLVAIKVFNGDFSEDRFQDFQRECRTLARVDWCPQIVTLYGTGVADSGYPYLAMEYCPGGSLADRVRRSGPLTEAEVRPIAKDVATALHIAHGAGVLHRDVKPANILISRSGSPVLCDFGIARFADALTSSVGVSATIAYAAPEVLLGKRATEASDIFSLGATLHALLTGRGPYAATGQESVQAILIRAALSDEELSVDQLPVSAGLRDVIARCLRRDPQERFASAEALLAALAALSEWSGAASAEPVALAADSGQPTSIPEPSPQPAEQEPAADSDSEPEPDLDVTEVENALGVDPVAGPEAESVAGVGEEPSDPEWAATVAAPTVRRQPTEQPVGLLASAGEASAVETEGEHEPVRVDSDAPDAHDDGPTRQSSDDMVSELPDLDVEATVLAGDVTVRRSAPDPPPADAPEEAQTPEPRVGSSGRSRRRKRLLASAITVLLIAAAFAGIVLRLSSCASSGC